MIPNRVNRAFVLPTLGVLALLMASFVSCRSSSPPAPTPVTVDTGSLMRFVHMDDPVWLHVDMTRARSAAALAAVWEGVPEDDPLAATLLASTEVQVVWTDSTSGQPLFVVRGPVNRDAVEAEARSGRRWSRIPMQSLLHGTTKVWKDLQTDRALAMPRENLLLAGSMDQVLTGLARSSPSIEEFAWSRIADARLMPSAMHRAWLRSRLPEPVREWVSAFSHARLELEEREGVLILRARLLFERGTSVEPLVPLLATWMQLILAATAPDVSVELSELVQIGPGATEGVPEILVEVPIPASLVTSVLATALPVELPDGVPIGLGGGTGAGSGPEGSAR